MKVTRILLVHAGSSQAIIEWHSTIAKSTPPSLLVETFPLSVPGFKNRIPWPILDKAWKSRHPKLIATYEKLLAAAENADVLLLYGGYNLHPEFLSVLPTFNAFCFYDDPESSDNCSRHIASAFDGVFYCNVASRFQYQDWGCHRISFMPIFTAPRDIPNPAEKEGLLTTMRTNDIILCCAWNGGEWRQRRLRKMITAFPQALCFGKGWPGGFVPDQELRDLYGRSRIGWNIHNSTGPINVRLYSLAAWNIMQICDNKTGLAEVFKLGHEIVGIDTIDEAIEATRYYLSHEEERQAIARRGYQRYWRDYTPEAIWMRIESQIRKWNQKHTLASEPAHVPNRATTVWPYRLRTTPLVLRRTMERWKISIRKRTKDVTWPIDERFYLGEHVSYQPDIPFKKRPRACSDRKAGQNRILETETLAWAAASMVGSARSILVLGQDHASEYFASFAGRDSARTISRHDSVPTGSPFEYDFIVAFNQGVDLLCEETLKHITPVESSIKIMIGLNDPQVNALGGCNSLFSQFGAIASDVYCFWLPNPVVPWIEPLPGPLPGNSLLMQGNLYILLPKR